MWIRSQSLAVLVKANEICIENKTNIWAEGYLIGKYSTEEKAFAVLDEIQGKIECPYPSKIMPAFGTNCYYLTEKNKFYQMPQDEDVEV